MVMTAKKPSNIDEFLAVKDDIGRLVICKNKIDYIALIVVTNANPNGDPLNDNLPRTDYDGYGEMSDVCIKHKLRNRLMDLGHEILIKSDDRVDDGFYCIKDRVEATIGLPGKGPAAEREFKKKACEAFYDVRGFGQVFTLKNGKDSGKKKNSDDEETESNKKEKGSSIGIRGPVTIQIAKSVAPVEIETMKITKCTVTEPDSNGAEKMGDKGFVKHGLYVIKGSINPQLARFTGYSKKDVDDLKECLRTLFVNDASSARPDGSMEVKQLYWWEHNCPEGQYSSAVVQNSVICTLKDPGSTPKSFDDYIITLNKLKGLEPEIIKGW